MQQRTWEGQWRFKHPTIKPRQTSGTTNVPASSKVEAINKIQANVSKELLGTENFKSHVRVQIKDVRN
ncbi:MAG: hypothetical protein V4690_00540 [Patescibacteria group bacterium]